jgi:hypothetical protein
MIRGEELVAERTYGAIGRFIFEFSQVEHTIRHYLAKEIGLKDGHVSEIVESYDVAILTTIAQTVFKKSRGKEAAAEIKNLLDGFHKLNETRKRVVHGLWVPFKEGGTVHHVSRSSLTSSASIEQAENLEREADKASKLRAQLGMQFSMSRSNSLGAPNLRPGFEKLQQMSPAERDDLIKQLKAM